jgi:hypothetical protein
MDLEPFIRSVALLALFTTATYLENLPDDPLQSYGGRSLHEQSPRRVLPSRSCSSDSGRTA